MGNAQNSRVMHPAAAIDIGTNAVRFLINNMGGTDCDKMRKLAFLRVPVRLGEDVFREGEISSEKQETLCSAMQGFASLMAAYGVGRYRACATSAMREAKNGAEVLRLLKDKSGLETEIITGMEEARLVCAAGDSEDVFPSGICHLYIDVGGGSTELSVRYKGEFISSASYPLGTVRILEGAAKKCDFVKFEKELKAIRSKYGKIVIVASGGNINKANKLLDKRTGETISAEELEGLYEDLAKLDCSERVKKYGLNPYRADVIVPALKIFLTAVKKSRAEQIYVPKVGLVDGILSDMCREAV
jgi:exopolyphosphatase/guanosine-5'-triphosphate,3'-diphosphate pyrophosphatase